MPMDFREAARRRIAKKVPPGKNKPFPGNSNAPAYGRRAAQIGVPNPVGTQNLGDNLMRTQPIDNNLARMPSRSLKKTPLGRGLPRPVTQPIGK